MSGRVFSHEPVEVDLIETRYRKIKTKLPVPESLPMFEKLYKIEAQALHGQLPLGLGQGGELPSLWQMGECVAGFY